MDSVRLIEIEITLSLPDLPIDEFDYTKNHYYPRGHRYAGSYEKSSLHNSLEDMLFTIPNIKKTCLHPWGPYVTFQLNPDVNVSKEVDKLKLLLNQKLKDFMEEHNESNRTE